MLPTALIQHLRTLYDEAADEYASARRQYRAAENTLKDAEQRVKTLTDDLYAEITGKGSDHADH